MLHRLGEPPSVLPDEKARGVCGRELRALAAQLRAAVGAHPGEKGVPVVRKTQIGDALAGLQRAPQLCVPGRSRDGRRKGGARVDVVELGHVEYRQA